MSGDLNPYTPPETTEPTAAPGYDWYTDLPTVHIRGGGVLPEICLETGRQLDLERIPRKLMRAHPIWNLWFLFYMGFLFAPDSLKEKYLYALPPHIPVLIIAAGAVAVSLAGTLIGRRSSRHIRFECWISRPHHQARQRRKYMRTGLFGLGIVMLLLGIIPTDTIPFGPSMTLLTGSVVILLAHTFWQYSDREKNHLTAGEKGWVRIGNVHLDAIRFLRQIERERGT